LLLLLPMLAYTQSLGDVARETRAEEEKVGVPHPKVITNDDIGQSPQAHEEDADATKPPSSARETDKATEKDATEPKNVKPSEYSERAPGKEQEAKELQTQRRTDEINKYYQSRIDSLRDQLNAEQLELGKLEGDRLDAYNDITSADNTGRLTSANSLNLAQYDTRMDSLNDQIDAKP